MLKIRALNRESSSDEDFPVIRREAQEEIALEQYNKALRLQNTGSLLESEKILDSLIRENIPQLENQGPLPQSMSTFKYSCHLNIGNIYMRKGEFNRALDHYLSASELDPTDVTLWYKIGQLAVKQDRFRQAIYAFAKGLECSESHWPCLDQIITLLFAIHDTIACLEYIGKALLLDPDYPKGLVLRRQIYRDNPFAKEYYQQYNPEYIWEPSLDTEIDEKDQKKFLHEAKLLSDHITEVEKALGPKPLQTIPLPIPLEDFTWVSLGKTVIALHQYITDNEMCHFTMVDLNRCMSQKEEPKEETSPLVEVQSMEIANEPEINQEEEKMEIETAIVERRQSQNSDNVNDGQENTPNQTDNDDEQIIEQDVDDQEDNSDTKTDKTSRNLNRTNNSKRKRDLLSDLQIWGWHSKRKSVKKGKTDKDFSVEDALNRIIPKSLLRTKIGEEKYQSEDSMNTMDIYNIYAEENKLNFLSPIHSPKSYHNEEYFGTEREKEDVHNLWTQKREYCDPIVLIRDFVFSLSKLWHFKWPNELVSMYLNAYDMFREHYDLPQIYCDDLTFEQIRCDALATLLYGELLNFSRVKDENRNIHMTALAFLQLISGWREDWQNEHISFFIRLFWLRAHIFRREGLNDLAIRALELIQDIIFEEEKNESFLLNLPNCLKCGLITRDIVTKILKHLDMITSLSCLEELYNSEKYKEVADILKLTFKNNNHPTCGRMGRPAQIAMLLHCLWYTDLNDCFQWTEECLHEALGHFLKPTKEYEKWEKIVEKCLAFLYEIIKMETVAIVDCLNEDKRARLVEILCKIVCKQLNTECVSKIPLGCITPWILLYYILMREEHRAQANKRTSHVKCDNNENVNEENEELNEDLPPSVAILFSAHEFLGPKGFCLTNSGELLHFILDSILDRLDTPIFEPYRDKIDIHIEQSLFCLYQHPSKKNKISRHLADHNVDPLSLTWQRAFQLYEFYGPDCLPEFNSYKNASVSADTEQLLQRIIALVPSECDPQLHVQKITDFINGKTEELPKPIEFPNKVRAIYYLIGDYYFKQREFNRCLKYFLMDLCINPCRFDSWACLGLSYVSQLDVKLNYCKRLKSEMEFLDKAKYAQICFKKALELDSGHVMLWIEFGSFEYMVHSFCSRIMKTESDTLSMEKFEYLENQKNSYLESSGRNFEKAIDLYNLGDESDADERWLQYYILGKVAEKKQKEPNEYLQYYVTAGKLLHENNAQYPEKINYHNPQPLSVEALEIHYRINASVLKYLELHESKEISTTIGNNFKKYLESSVFPKNIAPKPVYNRPNLIEAEIEEKLKNEEIRQEVKKCLEDLVVKVDEFAKKQEIKKTENIIVLSVSDEEQMEIDKSKDPQDLFDKIMEETMKISNDVELNTSSKIVEKADNSSKKKEESEINLNIQMSIDSSSTSSSSSSSSSSSESDSDEESSSSSTSSSTETGNDTMSQTEILALVDRCIVGLEQCIIRLPQNYKALYRLAHLYFNYKSRKDLTKSRQLMLSEYTCKSGTVVSGLFSDRKNHNFFNGIWRIPSSEIDRPGSLSAHMSRCITLLLQILRATNDNKTLLDLYMQFKKVPEPDKIYIKDSERIQFAEQAMTMCIQSFRSQIQNVQNLNNGTVQKLLFDIFRAYQRIQKHIPDKEATFSSMLTEVFRKFRKDKVPENVNVLELAIKFCQQNRIVEKQSALLISPRMTTLPVLPPPLSVTPNQSPSKRPGMGRPRGRPPLPKIPGQSRQQRGKSPNLTTSNPFAQWQKPLIDQNTAYNYMKHYQEELIKQYSKSLSISQLTQLSQYLNQNQMAQNQFSNQYFLGQNSLLSSPLVKQMGQFKTPNTNYLDNLKKFTGNKQTSKKNLPHTITSSTQAITSKVNTTATSYVNLSHTMTSTQSPNLNFPQTVKQSKSLPAKIDKPLSHSIASITQPVVCKTKSIPPTYKNSPSKYSTADLTKIKTNTQIFKEPKSINKSAANILMKDRPNISITPVMSASSSLITPSVFKSNPGKTLQEKLADKQKNLAKHLGRNIEAEIISSKEGNVKKTISSLSNIKFPLESGISISQVPVPKTLKSKERSINILQKKVGLTSVNLPPNLPISLSVTAKVDNKKQKLSDDDVIIIE